MSKGKHVESSEPDDNDYGGWVRYSQQHTEETHVPPVSNPSPISLEDPNNPLRWKHRRRIAYLALVSMLVVTIYVMGPWLELARLEKLNDVISWFYFVMASIVGAYMGFATWSAKVTH